MSFINPVFAVNLVDIYKPASKLGGLNATFSTLLNPLITNVLVVSALTAFFVIIIAGFRYITASGDKAKAEQAANMLNYALIGLVLIAAAYLVTRIVGSIVNIDLFNPN